MSNLTDLAAALVAAKQAKDEAEAAVKVAGKAVEDAERALFDAMVEAEMPKLTVCGFNFGLDTKTYYSVREGCGKALHKALLPLGCGDIFKTTVHYQTLNATLREIAERDEGKLPEDVAACVSVYDDGKVSMRKAGR